MRLVVCDGFSIEKCENLWLQLYVSFYTTKYKIWDITKNNQPYDKWNEVLLWKNTSIPMRIKNVQNCDEMWLYAYIFEVWHAFLKPNHNSSHLSNLKNYFENIFSLTLCFSKATTLYSSFKGFVILGG